MPPRLSVCVFLLVLMLAGAVQSEPNSRITYNIAEIGPGHWEYLYTVENIDLTAGIEQFIVWFDFSLYDNLAITTVYPPARDWTESIVEPGPTAADPGRYEAITQASPQAITIGHSAGGFAVSFDWLGTGDPGPQFYEILEPFTTNVIDSGWTIVPEPLTITLLGLGALVLCSHKKRS